MQVLLIRPAQQKRALLFVAPRPNSERYALVGESNRAHEHRVVYRADHARGGAIADPRAVVGAGQVSPFKRTILQRADVPGTNLELIIATVDIAPAARAGRHTHPGMTMAHVVDGDFWLHVDGRPEQILHAGECTSNPDRAIHDEGARDKPVRLHAVYVVEKGKPLASPAQ